MSYTHPRPEVMSSPSTPTLVGPAPPPPRALASSRPTAAAAAAEGEGEEALFASLNRTPLLMTSLDTSDGAGGRNVALEGLQALAYEGSPLEVARNFRAQGNDLFRARRWRDARELYEKGVGVLDERRRKREGVSTMTVGEERVVETQREEKEEVEEEVEGGEMELLEVLLLNRAACNLELQNYRQVIHDTQRVLSLSQATSTNNTSNTSSTRKNTHLKAHHRLIRAYLSLGQLTSASTSLRAAQHLHGAQNPHLVGLAAQLAQLERQAQRQRDADARRDEEARALDQALRGRGLLLVHQQQQQRRQDGGEDGGPDLHDATARLEDPTDPHSTLYVPLLVLFPLLARSDLIKSVVVHEDVSLAEQLACLFPVPAAAATTGGEDAGEEEGYKSLADVELFMQARPTTTTTEEEEEEEEEEGKPTSWAKIGKTVSLARIFPPRPQHEKAKAEVKVGPELEGLVHGLLRVWVVPSGMREVWLERERKVRRGKGGW